MMFISRNEIKTGLVFIFSAMLLILGLQGCAAMNKPTEHLSFNIENYDQWKFLKEDDTGAIYMMSFIPKEQTAENWRQMLESINVRRKDYPKTPSEAQQKLTNLRLQSCPETSIETIEEDMNSVTYSMSSINCPIHENPYQLSRILYGEDNVFILMYTQKGGEISPETRDQWLKSLNSAKID